MSNAIGEIRLASPDKIKEIKIVPLFAYISEVYETKDIDEVNKLVTEHWIVMYVCPDLTFKLGKWGKLKI